MSCRRQRMLSQGPASDPRSKLKISKFLTPPHLLGCLNCTRNALSIVLLLQTIQICNRWGLVELYLGIDVGEGVSINL